MLLDDLEDQANSLLADRVGPVLQVVQHRLDDLLVNEGKRRVLNEIRQDVDRLSSHPPVLVQHHLLQNRQHRLRQGLNAQCLTNQVNLLEDSLFDLLLLLILQEA